MGSQGSGHAEVRLGCIEGRINVLLSHPLVRVLSPIWSIIWSGGLAVHSPAYSRDAGCLFEMFQGKMRENGQRGLFHHRMGST